MSISESMIIEKSPVGRYICFNDVLGRGAYKVVYRGYDTRSGIEVAWNSIPIKKMNESDQKTIIKEINLLKELSAQNQHIMNFFNAWIDNDKSTIVFITEIALSGTLLDYIKKISMVNLRVIKKWSRQILEALSFLHSKNIVHRDLKCCNIFINSNTGHIMLGDFGLAARRFSKFHTIIGTPEYMAPEMYEEDYDEKIDIYAFGMCVIEMITKEVPYEECRSFGQIYQKVTHGELPESIETIKNKKAKDLILRCIRMNPKERPSAEELLNDPFLQKFEDIDNDDDLTTHEDTSDTDDSDDRNTMSLESLDTQESLDDRVQLQAGKNILEMIQENVGENIDSKIQEAIDETKVKHIVGHKKKIAISHDKKKPSNSDDDDNLFDVTPKGITDSFVSHGEHRQKGRSVFIKMDTDFGR